MGANSGDRGGSSPRLIVLHTNEGPSNSGTSCVNRRAQGLTEWMDEPTRHVSYHRVVDDEQSIHYVIDERASLSLKSGNHLSLNLCVVGRASFTYDEWMRHEGMLRRGAEIVRRWCERYRIPSLKLSPFDVSDGVSGVCGHVDWTVGKRDGCFTDPGAFFPWDDFMAWVNGISTPQARECDLAVYGMRDAKSGPEYIKRAQRRLRQVFRYAREMSSDGVFGYEMMAVLAEYQRRHDLPVTGKLDRDTWDTLLPC